MLRDLVMRDLVLHKRSLVGAGVTVGLMLGAWSLGSWDNPDWSRDAMAILGLILFLVSALPLSLQMREILQGTLGDLLVLPVSRRDLVRTRLLEGLLACLAAMALFLAVVAARGRLVPADLRAIFGNPVLIWVPTLMLGYTLPLACAGSMNVSWMAGPFVGLPFWMVARTFGPKDWNLFLDRTVWALEGFRGRPGGAFLLDWIAPVLVLALSYRISRLVVKRAEP